MFLYIVRVLLWPGYFIESNAFLHILLISIWTQFLCGENK